MSFESIDSLKKNTAGKEMKTAFPSLPRAVLGTPWWLVRGRRPISLEESSRKRRMQFLNPKGFVHKTEPYMKALRRYLINYLILIDNTCDSILLFLFIFLNKVASLLLTLFALLHRHRACSNNY